MLTDGLLAVEKACVEALSEGVHSADVILNILARQRDPGPPMTIMTSDALRLRAALKFLKRIMKKYGRPRSVVTNGLCSYPAAMKEIGNADRQEASRRLNNRA